MQVPFHVLDDVLVLAAQGHINAARAQWQSLSVPFRDKVRALLQECIKYDATELLSLPTIHMLSPFGEFAFGPRLILGLVLNLPKVDNG